MTDMFRLSLDLPFSLSPTGRCRRARLPGAEWPAARARTCPPSRREKTGCACGRTASWPFMCLPFGPTGYAFLTLADIVLTGLLLQDSALTELNPLFSSAGTTVMLAAQLAIIATYTGLFCLARIPACPACPAPGAPLRFAHPSPSCDAADKAMAAHWPALRNTRAVQCLARNADILLEFLVIFWLVRLFAVISNYLLFAYTIDIMSFVQNAFALPVAPLLPFNHRLAAYCGPVIVFVPLLLAAYPLIARVARDLRPSQAGRLIHHDIACRQFLPARINHGGPQGPRPGKPEQK